MAVAHPSCVIIRKYLNNDCSIGVKRLIIHISILSFSDKATNPLGYTISLFKANTKLYSANITKNDTDTLFLKKNYIGLSY